MHWTGVLSRSYAGFRSGLGLLLLFGWAVSLTACAEEKTGLLPSAATLEQNAMFHELNARWRAEQYDGICEYLESARAADPSDLAVKILSVHALMLLQSNSSKVAELYSALEKTAAEKGFISEFYVVMPEDSFRTGVSNDDRLKKLRELSPDEFPGILPASLAITAFVKHGVLPSDVFSRLDAKGKGG